MTESPVVPKLYETQIVHPGELHFGSAPAGFRTVLGSCIAITVWHPTLQVGGICHYVMVTETANSARRSSEFCSASKATNELLRKMEQYADKHQYIVSLWGGSHLFPCASLNIGEKNSEFAKEWVEHHGLTLKHVDIGGAVSRTLIFDLNDGCCYLKKFKQHGDVELYDH